MKKIELHVHLDGSVRPKTVSELLNYDIKDVKNKMMVTSDTKDLTEYLTKFDFPIKAMQTKDNLKRIARELALDLKDDDVIYAEVRFAPILHTKEGLSLDEVVSSVLEGIKSVNEINVNLILCMMRGFSYEDNLKTIMVTKKFLNKGVVGLDLAGDEKKYQTINYKDLFMIAKDNNIPFTIHAGEADTSKSVLDAINFGAKRIGHGIAIVNDEKILNLVKEKNVFLEVCPTSNVDTKAVLSYEKHPIKDLFLKGVKVTVNTDDRTVSNITLSKEYEKLKEYFNFSDEEFLQMNLNAISSSFMNEDEKTRYTKMIMKEKKLN